MRKIVITALLLAMNTSVFATGFSVSISPNCGGLSASSTLIGATNTILAVAPNVASTSGDYVGFYLVTSPTHETKVFNMAGRHNVTNEITFLNTKTGEYMLQYFNSSGVGLSSPFPFTLRSSSEISVETNWVVMGDWVYVIWNTEFCECVSTTNDTVGYYDKDNPSSFLMIPIWGECYDYAYFPMDDPGHYVFGYFKNGNINNNLSPQEVTVSALLLLTPSAGSAVGSTQMFSWTPVAGATEYRIYLGSYFGSNDLARVVGLTSPQVTLTNIPQDGRTLYMRIWYSVSGKWGSEDFMFQSQVTNGFPALGIVLVPTINIMGQINQSYKLQYIQQVGPTNTWMDLSTITVTNQPQYYADLSAIGKPSRFYRLVQLP